MSKPYLEVEQSKSLIRFIFNYDDTHSSIQQVSLDSMHGNAVYRKLSVGMRTLAKRIEKGIDNAE